MKVISLICIFMLLTSSFKIMASLPPSWYQHPEDHFKDFASKPTKNLSKSENKKQLKSLKTEYQKLLRSNSRMSSQIKNRSSHGWRLAEFHTGMAFSTAGKIGYFSTKGTSGVEFRFRRKFLSQKAQTTEVTPDERSIIISEKMTKQEIKRNLNPIIKYLVNNRGIKNQALLEKNLLKTATKFQNTIMGLNHRPKGIIWWPYRFKYQVWVDISGNIYHTPTAPFSLGINIGGATNLALYWLRLENKKPSKIKKMNHRKDSKLKLLSQTISRDIDLSFSENTPGLNPPYELSIIRVTLGQSVSGDLFLAKAILGAKGSLYFRKYKRENLGPGNTSPPIKTLKSYPLLSKISQNEIDYAMANGIPYKPLGQGLGKTPLFNIFTLDRLRFRNGLKKATQMANFFSSSSLDDSKSRWFLREIRSHFSLSIGGDLYMATVKKHSAVTFMIRKK